MLMFFCVGDDWQSIYGFSGSDVSLFHKFRKSLDYKELFLTKTHRNSIELNIIAEKFITKDKNLIVKALQSDNMLNHPIQSVIYSYDDADTDKYEAMKIVLQQITNGDKLCHARIMLLGRNNRDGNFLKKINGWKCCQDSNNKNIFKCKEYPNVSMYFLTVHSSKGLEEDNVVILNMEDDILGFPNKVIDDYLLSPLLIESESNPLAEERRIFYVALTRTKYRCYMLVPNKNKSCFYDEIKNNIYNIQNTQFAQMAGQENIICPRCKSGRLIRKYNHETKEFFLACTNYNKGNGCKYTVSYKK